MTTNTPPTWHVTPQGDRTLVLALDTPVSVKSGRQCAAVAMALRTAGLPGIIDVVPSFNAVAVHYQPRHPSAETGLDAGTGTLFSHLAQAVTRIATDTAHQTDAYPGRTIDIPVCYGGDFGPDLDDVARHCGLDVEQVIALHSGEPAYVFMLGFAPGAAYIGMHDDALDIPRRDTPRTALPKGAVAIANRQTIIYPNPSPGGWHVIGTTPLGQFYPSQTPPTLLAPGDMVRFVPITPDQFYTDSSPS